MDKFRVLVVEDDLTYCESIRALVLGENIDVRIVSTKADALTAIRESFFHAAFVDLHLVRDDARNVDGQLVLAHLRNHRPSCKRYLLTKYPEKYRKHFFDLLTPLNPTLHGAIDKEALRDHAADIIPALAERYLRRAVRLVGTQNVLDEMQKRGVKGEHVDLTLAEADHLISSIFGQDADYCGEASEDDVSEIGLSLLSGGRSRSAVSVARPKTLHGIRGVNSVIKVGPSNEIAEEYRRYCRHVRFVVSQNRRVELLGYALGDTLGAICYSFAGRSPESVRSLGQLFDKSDDQAIRVLEEIFAPDSKEWLGREGKGRNLGGYFVSTYTLDTISLVRDVASFAERIAPEIKARKDGSVLHLPGKRLPLPTAGVLGDGRLQGTYAACIVHGDMNPENVLVSDDRRSMFIDYRYTGWGPRLLDFAALEGSVRIREPSIGTSLLEIPKCIAIEDSLWNAVWSNSTIRTELPFWGKFSLTLRELARKNFPSSTESEYASTCLLWCFRMFRLTRLGDLARLRLLIWMAFLTDRLAKTATVCS